AFRALPDGDVSTGVVILPDARGLYRSYEELAPRFAERGHAAIAFDYFGRTAGVDKRPDGWDYMPPVPHLTHEQVQAHVPTRGRAAQLLRPQAGGVPGRVRRRLAAHARLYPGAYVGPAFPVGACRPQPRRERFRGGRPMGELVADYFLKRLREWDVHRIYGYPGDGINAFLGALDRADGDPDFIQARHEEMAAFMACGHAKFAGPDAPGVRMATSGPGAMHLL